MVHLEMKALIQRLKHITLAIPKLKRIANQTVIDGDMIGENVRTTTNVNVISSIFQDGDQTVHFGTQMALQCLKQITLAIPKLKLIANRTIIDGDVIGEKGSTTINVNVILAIFKMAAKRYTMRQKGIRDRLTTFK